MNNFCLKKGIIRLFFAAFVGLIPFNSIALNFDFNANQKRLITEVIEKEINNDIHRAFWSSFSKNQIHEARSTPFLLDTYFPKFLAWQKAVWTSVRESYLSGSVVRTNNYIDMKEELSNGSLINISELKAEIKKADKMLELASKGGKFYQNNKVIVLDDKNADLVIMKLDKSFERLEKLFNPDWSEEVDMASPTAYAGIVSSQETWQKRTAVCFRYWHVASAVLEIAYKDEKLKNNLKKLKKISHSLFNVKIREFFIESVIKEYSLKELSERAYSLGTGVDFSNNTTPSIIQDICVIEINKYLERNLAFKLYSEKKARQFMESIR